MIHGTQEQAFLPLAPQPDSCVRWTDKVISELYSVRKKSGGGALASHALISKDGTKDPSWRSRARVKLLDRLGMDRW